MAHAHRNKSDYVLYIDDDMTFPPNTLDRLIKDKKDVVGVASHSRMLPLRTTVQLLNGDVPKKFPKKI